MKEKRFQGVPEKSWAPLLATIIDSHNTAMMLSAGDNGKYGRTIAGMCEMLKTLYVGSGALNIWDYNKFWLVTLYVLNEKMNLSEGLHDIDTYTVFKKVKKYWDDINAD